MRHATTKIPRVVKSSDARTVREKLGHDVNAEGMEIGALFSPSGKSLLFSRDTGAPESGEFFIFRESGDEHWPPSGVQPDRSPAASSAGAAIRSHSCCDIETT